MGITGTQTRKKMRNKTRQSYLFIFFVVVCSDSRKKQSQKRPSLSSPSFLFSIFTLRLSFSTFTLPSKCNQFFVVLFEVAWACLLYRQHHPYFYPLFPLRYLSLFIFLSSPHFSFVLRSSSSSSGFLRVWPNTHKIWGLFVSLTQTRTYCKIEVFSSQRKNVCTFCGYI